MEKIKAVAKTFASYVIVIETIHGLWRDWTSRTPRIAIPNLFLFEYRYNNSQGEVFHPPRHSYPKLTTTRYKNKCKGP